MQPLLFLVLAEYVRRFNHGDESVVRAAVSDDKIGGGKCEEHLMSALTRIADFATASGSGNGAFPGIARADIVTGLRERVANPKKIDTSNVNLCGPAAFFYCLVNDDPEAYVKYVIDLYTTGKGMLGKLEVTPGSDCRHHRPDKSKIAPVDWVALASLRDSENSFFDFDSDDIGAGGITMPHSMKKWMKACGYDHIRDTTSVWVLSSASDFDAINHLYFQGRWVFLFINANMLSAKTETDWSVTPDHWVVLTSAVPVTGGQTSFSVFSWGREYQIKLADTSALRRNWYGYIATMKVQIGDFPIGAGAAAV
jgi:hypothetical protein